ncbi:MAG: hypothetical protein LBJ90_04995, partial [Treponema sp.]|nr:hypothetical protein [Treponema sp.]
MTENAGIIEAKIQLNIDDLKKGAVEAQKAVQAIEVEAKKSNAETINAFRGSTQAVFDYNVELKNIALAEKTGSMTSQEASKARLNAAQRYLDVLINVRNRIAEVSGEESKEVAIYDKLIKKQVELRNSAREIAEAGEYAGKGFFNGINKGFKQTADQAKKLGANIAKSLSPALIGLAAGIKTVQAIGGAIKDAFMSNEKFRESVDNLKSALGESFSASVRPVSNFFAGIIENAAKSIKQANDLKEALKRLKEETPDYGDVQSQKSEKIIADFEALNAQVNKLREKMENPSNLPVSRLMAFITLELNKSIPKLEEAKAKLEDLQKTVGNSTPRQQEMCE